METTYRMKRGEAMFWNARGPTTRRVVRSGVRRAARKQAEEVGASVAIIVDTHGRQVDSVEVKA